MKIAYFDLMSGLAGDMMLGALVDAGVDLAAIQAGVDSLGLPDCRLEATEVHKKGFRATKVNVLHEPEHAHRHLHHIVEMIDQSFIDPAAKSLAKRIFTRLGEAEAKVHGQTLQKVHFHEVGAVDSIADIVGSAIGLIALQIDRIVCSPVPVGGGEVTIAHGRVSVPAPATAELLVGIPTRASNIQAELTTPTGAAIVATVADEFGSLPGMTIESIGYGAGDKDFDAQANVFRLLVGDSAEDTSQVAVVLETNLDDVSGEVIGHTIEKLFAAGALDVTTSAIQMKKNRPGVTLSVICESKHAKRLEKIIFRETGTLGVRQWNVTRHKLERRECTVNTQWGEVAGKVAVTPDGESFSPEYEACRSLAVQHDLPLRQIYEAATAAYQATQDGN